MRDEKKRSVPVNELNATLKASALIGLVEKGVIPREDNGDIDDAGFNDFWTYYERNLETAFAAYAHDVLKMAEQCTDECRNDSDCRRYELIFTALTFVFGFVLGFLFK